VIDVSDDKGNITRDVIVGILTKPDNADYFENDDVLDGIRTIAKFIPTVNITPIDYFKFKSIAVDTMLAYNFNEEACKELSNAGWFIEDEYLVIEI
jgi:hypothetical protein